MNPIKEPVKIGLFTLENVKKIILFTYEPTPDGLIVIGGDNGQGKTSILDALAWALGGNKYRPDNPNRDGADSPARIRVELSNGLVVERKGKNGTLHVTDPTGMKGTQRVLDEFTSELAICLPKFLHGTDKERTDALLRTLGIDGQLAELDAEIKSLFAERTSVGKIAKRDAAYAESMPHYDDAPAEPVSVADLIQQQQAILAKNAENQRKRDDLWRLEWDRADLAQHIASADKTIRGAQEQLERYVASEQERIDRMRTEIADLQETLRKKDADLETARHDVARLVDESMDEIERSIANAEDTNAKVRANQAKTQAVEQAAEQKAKYEELTSRIEDLRKSRLTLLNDAPLPLPGLSINDGGDLTYNGQTWGDMSGSERLRVATAIVRATKPECGFVLVDELEQLDTKTLAEFGAWAQAEGLQVIGTRVSTGDECTVVIQDGMVAE